MMIQTLLCDEFFENGEGIVAKHFVERREVSMHSHEFWEISYVHESKGTSYIEGGGSELIKTGEFMFVSPGISHCIVSPPKEKGAWVRVCNFLMKSECILSLISEMTEIEGIGEYELVKMILCKQPFCIHLNDEAGIIFSMLSAEAHEYRYQSQGSDIIIRNFAFNILFYIVRMYEEIHKSQRIRMTEYDAIDDLIGYIKSNYQSDLSLSYLSAYTNFSPTYLSRCFRKRTGMTLSDFIVKTRLDKAKQLLRTNDHSIQDISDFCGFGSVVSFRKAFKKYTGMNASEYRRPKKNK